MKDCRTSKSAGNLRSTRAVSTRPGHTQIECGEGCRNESSAPARGHRSTNTDTSGTARPFIGTFTVSVPAEGLDMPGLLLSLEAVLIGEALARSGGQRARAAKLLGINRTTLVEKLRRHPRLAEVQS